MFGYGEVEVQVSVSENGGWSDSHWSTASSATFIHWELGGRESGLYRRAHL